MNKSVVGGILIAAVCGGGGFAGGVAYQKKKTPTFPDRANFAAAREDGSFQRGSGTPTGTQRAFGGGIMGEVQSIDATSMTVKTVSGSVQTVYLGSSTTYTKDAAGSASDVAVGSTVSVTGTSNSDNSVTATAVRLEAPRE